MRINPNEVYRWFMEMFIDSYDWVMVPNVYGMGNLLMEEFLQLNLYKWSQLHHKNE